MKHLFDSRECKGKRGQEQRIEDEPLTLQFFKNERARIIKNGVVDIPASRVPALIDCFDKIIAMIEEEREEES